MGEPHLAAASATTTTTARLHAQSTTPTMARKDSSHLNSYISDTHRQMRSKSPVQGRKK